MVPVKYSVLSVANKDERIVYIPVATTETAGIVKIGEGLKVDYYGLLSIADDVKELLDKVKIGDIVSKGFFEHRDDFKYSKNTVVYYDKDFYVSLVDDNDFELTNETAWNRVGVKTQLDAKEVILSTGENAEDVLLALREELALMKVTLEEQEKTLNEKVDKKVPPYYLTVTDTHASMSYSPNKGTVGSASYAGFGVTKNTVTISTEVGQTGRSSGTELTIDAGVRPTLKMWGDFEFVDPSLPGLPEKPEYPFEGSPLATQYDLDEKVSHTFYEYDYAEQKPKQSTITNKENIILSSSYGENTNTVKVTPTTFTLNDKNIALEEYVDNKVSDVNAIKIMNKEPNLVVESTEYVVQEVATQYIVDNYGRQPQPNDGLFITFTDKNNDVIKYAFFNGAWINVGLNDIDLSNYVKNTDYATAQKAGIVRASDSGGLQLDSNGFLYTVPATENNITNKDNTYRPITAQNLDFAVKTGITNNSIELTDEEKATAQNWFGIESGGIEQLVGTEEKPINLATDMRVGHAYALNGVITYKSSLPTATTSRYMLAYKDNADRVTIFNYSMGSTITHFPGVISDLAINSNTGLVTSEYKYTMLQSINSSSVTTQRSIFAPTSGGTNGQILQSNGAYSAPTWTTPNFATIDDINNAIGNVSALLGDTEDLEV